MKISIDEFLELHPKLYHMAEPNSWESISTHGLLSTLALLDLFEIPNPLRKQILETHRPNSMPIFHKHHGNAVIRDQKPMSDSALRKCLQDDLQPTDWYRLLNGKTFFWTTKERLLKLLNARAYRQKRHCVLTVDTRELISRHNEKITLSPLNSGSTIFKPQPRGYQTFKPLQSFDVEYWRTKRSLRKIFVELVVDYSVPDIKHFTDRVELMEGSSVTKVLFKRIS